MLRIFTLLFLSSVITGVLSANWAQQEVCNKYLLTQNAIANCTYGSWDACGPAPPGLECCDHWHLAMSWDECLPAAGLTESICGDRVVRKFTMIKYICDSEDPTDYNCFHYGSEPCKVHKKNHDVLDVCPD